MSPSLSIKNGLFDEPVVSSSAVVSPLGDFCSTSSSILMLGPSLVVLGISPSSGGGLSSVVSVGVGGSFGLGYTATDLVAGLGLVAFSVLGTFALSLLGCEAFLFKLKRVSALTELSSSASLEARARCLLPFGREVPTECESFDSHSELTESSLELSVSTSTKCFHSVEGWGRRVTTSSPSFSCMLEAYLDVGGGVAVSCSPSFDIKTRDVC